MGQMVGRGVHFLWRGSFTRRIISVQSSCNLSRKKNKHTVNETRRRAKNKTLTAYLLEHTSQNRESLRKQRKVTARKWRRDLGQDDSLVRVLLSRRLEQILQEPLQRNRHSLDETQEPNRSSRKEQSRFVSLLFTSLS